MAETVAPEPRGGIGAFVTGLLQRRSVQYTLGIIIVLILGKIFLSVELPLISVAAEPIPTPEHPWQLGPLTITNALLTSWLVSIVLVIFMIVGTLRLRLVPGGLQNVIEMLIEGFII